MKNVSNLENEELEKTLGLKICNKVKYLGIWITPKNINLFQDNYMKIWLKIKRNLEIWSS